MIGIIQNFNIESFSRNESTTSIIFSFDIPLGDRGAYELHKSTNNNVYDIVDVKVDNLFSSLESNTSDILITQLNNILYFEYTIPSEDDGKTLYFKLRAISRYHEQSVFSNILIFNNYCSAVNNTFGYYDNFNITTSWNSIDFNNYKNNTFKDYLIFRQGVTSITDIDFDTTENIFYSPSLTLGKFIWVVDSFTRSYWCSAVTTEGQFTIDDTTTIIQDKTYVGVVTSIIDANQIQIAPPTSTSFLYKEALCTISGSSKIITENINAYTSQISVSNTSSISIGDSITISEQVIKLNDRLNLTTAINRHNLKVYMEDGELSQVGNTKETLYLDNTYEKERHYVYKICTRNIDGLLTSSIAIPVFAADLLKAIPYLRHPSNSETDIVKQVYWKSMKNSLVDKNYYLKERFDLPYLHNKNTHLKGYLGVSNCNVDIFVNDILTNTIVSDLYGEFDFYYIYPKDESRIKFQARDKDNIELSRISSTYVINTVNSYTTFGILGEVLEEYIEELNSIRVDNNINTARYSTFITKYAPYIELYKSGEEDDADFMELASTVFTAYEYAGYDKSLNLVLEKIKEKTSEFDHYEIYTRYSLYDTIMTGRFFVPRTPHLSRSNYYYGVSAVKITGEETPVSVVRVDSRWWPFNYKGYNAFMWDESANADSYKIYRGESLDNLHYLATVQNNVFIDNGDLVENVSVIPYNYNYSGMNIPKNFNVYLRTKVSQLELLYKKLGNTVILLYVKENQVFPELQLTRLKQLFSKLIPPEIRYTVLVIRDTSIYIYPDDVLIEGENNLLYGTYDHTLYDNNEVYG